MLKIPKIGSASAFRDGRGFPSSNDGGDVLSIVRGREICSNKGLVLGWKEQGDKDKGGERSQVGVVAVIL